MSKPRQSSNRGLAPHVQAAIQMEPAPSARAMAPHVRAAVQPKLAATATAPAPHLQAALQAKPPSSATPRAVSAHVRAALQARPALASSAGPPASHVLAAIWMKPVQPTPVAAISAAGPPAPGSRQALEVARAAQPRPAPPASPPAHDDRSRRPSGRHRDASLVEDRWATPATCRPGGEAARPCPVWTRVVQRQDRKVTDEEIWRFIEPFLQKAKRYDEKLAPHLMRSNLVLSNDPTATDPNTGKIKLNRREPATALVNWASSSAAVKGTFETQYIAQLLHEAEHSLGVKTRRAVSRPDTLRGIERNKAWAREEDRTTTALIRRLSGILKRLESAGEANTPEAARIKEMIFIQKRYRWDDWVGATFHKELFLAEATLDLDWKEVVKGVERARSMLREAKQPEPSIITNCRSLSRAAIARLKRKHGATLEKLEKQTGLAWQFEVDDQGMPRRKRVDTRKFTFGGEEVELYSTEAWEEAR